MGKCLQKIFPFRSVFRIFFKQKRHASDAQPFSGVKLTELPDARLQNFKGFVVCGHHTAGPQTRNLQQSHNRNFSAHIPSHSAQTPRSLNSRRSGHCSTAKLPALSHERSSRPPKTLEARSSYSASLVRFRRKVQVSAYICEVSG